MAVNFSTIPNNLRVPLFWAEFDNSAAGYGANQQRALIVGQSITPLLAVAVWPRLISGYEEAAGLFGPASMLAQMVKAYRANDQFGEIWVYPYADVTAGTAAKATVTMAGPATSAGVLFLYIGGQLVTAPVAVGATANSMAAALSQAINAAPEVPVTATVASAVVTLTARHKGDAGNAIDVRFNYRGGAGNESFPVGASGTVVAMSGGAADPDLSGLAAALGDEEYDFIVSPYSGSAQLDAVRDMMNDQSGRWSWLRQAYGHVFSARAGDFAGLQAFGTGRNDQHATILGLAGSPTPAYVAAAIYAAASATALRADPARPLQTVPLIGLLAPTVDRRLTRSQQQTLLSSGVALADWARDGSAMILRAVTSYQRNRFGQADGSYLDTETLFIGMAVIRRLRSVVTQKFARHKLANDGTRFGAGQAIVTPKIVKAELVAQYAIMVDEGLVEDADGFAAATIVERASGDPSRVNVLYAPNFINGLRVFAVVAQFRS